MMRASSGSSLTRGSYSVVTASSMPPSRYPRWRGVRMIRRLIVCYTGN
jgi:hypothetical protein